MFLSVSLVVPSYMPPGFRVIRPPLGAPISPSITGLSVNRSGFRPQWTEKSNASVIFLERFFRAPTSDGKEVLSTAPRRRRGAAVWNGLFRATCPGRAAYSAPRGAIARGGPGGVPVSAPTSAHVPTPAFVPLVRATTYSHSRGRMPPSGISRSQPPGRQADATQRNQP